MFHWRSETRGWRLAAAACLAAGLAGAQQPTHFSADVNLVRVVTTVKDQAGQLVGSLKKEDFEITDNGVPQELKVFERQTEQPVSVALLIDTSGTTGKDLKYETDAASRFLRALLTEGSPKDSVQLYSVNADVRVLCDFTHNYASLIQPFRMLHSEGATALFQSIAWASQALEKREGRKVVLLVTDGDDTYSRITAPQALQAAQMADAVVYSVVVVPITNPAGRMIGGEHALIYMAQGTGGRVFMPTLGPEMDRAFADIVSELRTQYMLGFYPRNVPPTKDRFHKLQVKASRPELQVSSRNGYYGGSEGATSTADARISVVPDNAKKLPEKATAPPDKTKKR